MDLQTVKNRFNIIGNSQGLNYALNVAVQVAATDLSVLIVGESGVGKEVFSQIIHALSSRKHNKFIAVNCGAIPEGTIDSELFGHEKGAFTGAVDSRKGYFETVSGGTIFLDEIGEMPIGTQARLLRVLETGEYIRVGSSKVQKTDVRVIAATNRDLYEFTQNGKFREDLYYRLSTVPIRVPALKDRKDDISLLFRKFVVDFAEKYRKPPLQLDPQAMQLLISYPWPGNVRELKNIAEQISVLSKSNVISPEEMQQFLPEYHNNRLPVLAQQVGQNNSNEFINEREILYKLFFDMKKDVNELKKMLGEILQNPEIANSLNDYTKEKLYQSLSEHEAASQAIKPYYANAALPGSFHEEPPHQTPNHNHQGPSGNAHPAHPVILNADRDAEQIHSHEEVEETLNIMDKEKELITKALKKHRGKRKDAAYDLGISERTLYRKLKEYHIDG
ncbi:sigma-54 dependent transcriptional regulator [Arachidicoccus ginsenosidivorans]|jgi:transcriptional regulator with PAS, ATPase and Fis domain|uniref:Sigma-54-dependent Fis family transcriptional regulator n=1 Tax=Arachidicoccus ginsenosidivorans TaxID=496057 RepID=A0A5B8VND7_9BACT|nr:sigma-54 dependent transcriptional regulator [Arachidicoccus ginsenosidivorans]QEC72156.1 sigma-54-dependent Fis family transcriptional regulator [Arachidicoccus ginsenosidivorans]